jgi:hypothetical protein
VVQPGMQFPNLYQHNKALVNQNTKLGKQQQGIHFVIMLLVEQMNISFEHRQYSLYQNNFKVLEQEIDERGQLENRKMKQGILKLINTSEILLVKLQSQNI